MLRIRKEQKDRAVKLHILSLAAVTTKFSVTAVSSVLINELSELLSSIIMILNTLLSDVPNKEILKIFRSTFLSNNLLCLRIY